MIVFSILIILSVLTSGSIYYFTGAYTNWPWIFLFIVIIPILLYIWFLIYLIPLFIASLFMSQKKPQEKISKVAYWFIYQTSFVVPTLFKARMKVSGEFPKERSLIISNHTSNFDPMPITYFSKNQPVISVTKLENFKLPIAGNFIWKAGFIGMDRENDFNAVKSIVRAANHIKNNESSIYICPEGTRNHHPENGMLDWHAGSLKIAYKAKCPITVVAMKNANLIASNFWLKFTNFYIDVVEVIPYEKYKEMNTQELANYCKNLIANKLAERS